MPKFSRTPSRIYSRRRHIASRFTIIRGFLDTKDQGWQDKKQWEKKEPCFTNDFENDVAAVFRSTAEGETGHAHGHLEYMEAVGDPATGLPMGNTADNLRASVAGETHEYTDMYPGMAKTARDEGFDEIADWFETLAKAERSHANRFQKALDAMD